MRLYTKSSTKTTQSETIFARGWYSIPTVVAKTVSCSRNAAHGAACARARVSTCVA